MRTLLHTCVKVHEAIELSFGVVSGVGSGIGVLDGGLHAPRKRGGYGVFSPYWFGWHF